MQMPSQTGPNSRFAQAPQADIPRSVFNRSHPIKTTFDSGLLIPIHADEMLPGDTFNVRAKLFARMATPLHPVMDRMRLSTFFFAVPKRLLWENWERHNGAQDNPDDDTSFLIPQIVSTGMPGDVFPSNGLMDYLGVAPGVPNDSVAAWWSRAYALIYNEWFRDQNLIDSVPFDTGDGPDDPTQYTLQRRCKRKDYFTGSLPWTQKGDAVTLPLFGDYPPIIADPSSDGIPTFDLSAGGGGTGWKMQTGNLTGNGVNVANVGAAPVSDVAWDQTKLVLDVTAASATINELRESFAFQKILERDARGGTRYVEMIKAHFRVTSPDARMMRPEYIGGGVQDINSTVVPQQSSTVSSGADASPQGNLAAFTTSYGDSHRYVYSATEHVVILGLCCVTADLSYAQGTNRMFHRLTRYDEYLPALAHLGEQAILNKEIYADGTPADDEVFGYQERWAEYRYKPGVVTGLFRPQHPQSLATWTLTQEFATRPALNQAFVEENPPIDRVLAVTDEPEFILDGWFEAKAARPMPVFSVPGHVDRF